MTADPKSKLLSLALIALIASLFITGLATRNRQSPYTPNDSFAGCYSNGADRLMLSRSGELIVNGTRAGFYKIVGPVGGKHGFLVEANGLNLSGGRGDQIKATPGVGGFTWPIRQGALDITFAPDTATTLRKMLPSC